ncbi:MAG TPA: dockerin type I repeat-containing protein, partial [Bacteroidales bacterium]|nr:dockerin type I repeat-containing protein [Bacteroidales bacterium]
SGGINSIDALLILQHFTGLQYLSGLRLLAADVNTSNYVNASDALLVQRHFVELITTFPAGDWIFDEPAFSIGPEDILLINLYGLCFGDVNGSFSP